MPTNKPKKIWADPNIEGRSRERKGKRFCARCGNTVQQARILKSLNLCEFCLKELETKRDGKMSCRSCGKVAPLEIQEHNGYCTQCVCSACGKPDPMSVVKTGLCFHCAQNVGDFCRKCGKEAGAQVRKNHGLCDVCAAEKQASKLHAKENNQSRQGSAPKKFYRPKQNGAKPAWSGKSAEQTGTAEKTGWGEKPFRSSSNAGAKKPYRPKQNGAKPAWSGKSAEQTGTTEKTGWGEKPFRSSSNAGAKKPYHPKSSNFKSGTRPSKRTPVKK